MDHRKSPKMPICREPDARKRQRPQHEHALSLAVKPRVTSGSRLRSPPGQAPQLASAHRAA